MNKLKKGFLSFTVLSVLIAGSLPATAAATGWPVSDVGLLAYLSNSAAGGVVTDNGGVISLLTQISSDLQHTSTQNTELAKNKANTDAVLDKLGLENQAALSRRPGSNACYSATSTLANGGGSSNTASNSTSSGKAVVNSVINASSPGPESKNFVQERITNSFCSEDDVRYNRGGCTSTGEYPSGDVDGGALSGAPLTQVQVGTSDAIRSDTYTKEQAVKIQTLVKNATTNLVPEDLKDKGSSNTSAGVAYKTQLSAYQAKATLAASALNDQIALRTEMPSLNSQQQNSWSGYKDNWKVWTGKDAPEKPSEFDLIVGGVYSRYADMKWNTSVQTMNTEELLRESVMQNALTNKMLLELLKNQQKQTQLSAASLGSQLQPVNYQSLNNMRDQISHN